MPEKIENIYIRSQYVHQVFVHGESLKSCVVAIVVPDVDVIKCWALENSIPGTLSVLCANPEVKRLIHDDMISWGKEAGLRSFEQVMFFHRLLTGYRPQMEKNSYSINFAPHFRSKRFFSCFYIQTVFNYVKLFFFSRK